MAVRASASSSAPSSKKQKPSPRANASKPSQPRKPSEKTWKAKASGSDTRGKKRPATGAAAVRASKENSAKRLKKAAETQRDLRHELVVRCNKIWNDLREKDLEEDKRKGLCSELLKLLKGKVLSFSQRPDTSRVIQTMFKYGDEEVRRTVLEELTSHMAVLSKGKHSSFLVISLLRYGNEAERVKVASEIRDHVRSLGTHANGARVINYCLCGSPGDNSEGDVVSDAEKKRFYENFYGMELTLFHSQPKKVTKEGEDKDPRAKQHQFDLANYLPEDESKRSTSLQYLKKLVLKIAEKGLLRFPFAQFLCWQVVANSTRENVCEMIPSISEAALAMVGTLEGTMAVARCLLAADAKDRKRIIKEWKGHVADLCAHMYGWYVVCRALDSVDDTKFLEKAIVEEMCDKEDVLKGLLLQEEGYGRKVFMRILAPDSRVAKYFERFEENFKSDPEGLSTSKKDPAVRSAELFDKMRSPLVKVVAANADEMLKSARGTDVVRELFDKLLMTPQDATVTKELKTLVGAVVDCAADCLEDARAHVTLKRMIHDEAEMIKGGSEVSVSIASELAGVLKDRINEFAKVNRAAFVLEALAQHPKSRDLVKQELTPAAQKKLPKDVKGTEALLKALKG